MKILTGNHPSGVNSPQGDFKTNFFSTNVFRVGLYTGDVPTTWQEIWEFYTVRGMSVSGGATTGIIGNATNASQNTTFSSSGAFRANDLLGVYNTVTSSTALNSLILTLQGGSVSGGDAKPVTWMLLQSFNAGSAMDAFKFALFSVGLAGSGADIIVSDNIMRSGDTLAFSEITIPFPPLT